MTLIFELDTDRVKLNHEAIYLAQKSFRFKVIVCTYRHTNNWPIALPGH